MTHPAHRTLGAAGAFLAGLVLGGAALAAPSPAVKQLCARQAACGCGLDDCEADASMAEMPVGILTCVAGLDCAALCAPNAGDEDSVMAKRCFSEAAMAAAAAADPAFGGEPAAPAMPAMPEPPALPAAAPAMPATAAAVAAPPAAAGPEGIIQQACGRPAACGCPAAGSADCVSTAGATAAQVGIELYQCIAGLECAAVCDPQAAAPGSVAHTRCFGPAMARVQAGVNQAARLQAQHHQMMMGIIGNMGATRGVKVYDQNGVLIREE
ncbi:MAG: hypothetical protein H6706_23985 [Myxococcales bacterium]|nr:hypothetical protein [Myxococcales bacterium]